MQLPLGSAQISRNNRYTPQSVGTRWGFTNRIKFGAQNSALAALGVIRYLANDNSGREVIGMAAYTATDGNIYAATPFQQSSVTVLTTTAFINLANIPLVPGLRPMITQAFNKGMIAMGNLTSGVAPNMVYDPNAGTIDEISDIPFAAPWNPLKRYRIGQVISPSTFETDGLPAQQGTWVPTRTGHLYRCVVPGTSFASPPVFPTPFGATVTEVFSTLTWEEHTPVAISGLPDPGAPITPTTTSDGGSPIIDQATVFIALTYLSANGESINELVTPDGILDPSRVLQFKNITGGPVDVSVITPAIPTEFAAGGPLGANGATGYQAYAFISQGTPDVTKYTDPTFYAQIPGGPFAAGATVTVNAFPIGAPLPTVNTAIVATAGNVDAGVRWMVWMFETRTEYITGFTNSAPIRVNVTQAGLQLLNLRVPQGPYNCVRRIAAFTVAGASAAGPYFYVDQDDVESPGFNQADVPITATTINDNTTTQVQFNFTDTYLPGASEVTEYFNRIEVPPASAIAFSKTLAQVIYTGCPGFPSGFLVSDLDDPEAVRVPGSNLQCAESDGDRTVGWGEIRENQIALKENSGHAVIPNDGDPSTWAVHRLWSGSGPCGAKAWDIATEDAADFMVYAHHDGPYRFVGGAPQLVGKEIGAVVNTTTVGLWKRINWSVGYKIVVVIDPTRREVRFSVPLDFATECNTTITLSYALGWDDAVIFIVRTGREVPNINGRRWSVDDLVALDWVYIPQRYQVSSSQHGVDLNNEIVMCSPDGAAYTLTEGQLFDQNWAGQQVGYFSQWISVFGSNPTRGIFSLQGATMGGTGNGNLNVYAVDDKGRTVALSKPARTMVLTSTNQQRDFGLAGVQGTLWGIGFDNGGLPGAGYLIDTAILWLRKFFNSRKG